MEVDSKIAPILVTGGCGMVGSHMVDHYFNQGIKIVATFCDTPTINLEEVKHKAEYVYCDVRYKEHVAELIEKYRPEVIYHLAAQSYPTVSWERPVYTMDVNVNGTIHVFEAIKSFREKEASYDPIVLIACSSAEYGASLIPENLPANENVPFLPLHPYGVSKVSQDLLGYQYFVNDKIRCIRVRIFNTTGPRKTNDVVSDFTKRAVLWEKGKVEKMHVGNLNTRRAITDVRDLISAMFLLEKQGKAGDVYNVSGNKIYEIRQIVDMIGKVMGQDLPVEIDPVLLRSSDEPIICGDSTKLIQLTGWEQHFGLETTIQDMIAYWRQVL